MARPQKDVNEKPALERIEEAFWALLAQNPYSNITIARLAREAKVNHNTIYYYFDNIDDLASKLFYKNIAPEITQAILTFASTGDNQLTTLLENPEIMKRWQRTRLFIRGDSAYLMNCYKKCIIDTWFTAAAIEADDLTELEQVVLNFIISGLIAVIASPMVSAKPILLTQLLERPIGKEMAAALSSLHKMS